MASRKKNQRWRKHATAKKPYTKSSRAKMPWNSNRQGSMTHIPHELKFGDFELVAGTISTAWASLNPGTIDCLSAIAQGGEESNRIGRVYWIHSIHIQGEINTATLESAVFPPDSAIIRLVMVMDKQTNGNAVVASTVMDAGQTTDVHAFRNMQNQKRYWIMWDHKFVFRRQYVNEGSINLFANGDERYIFRHYHVFKKPIKVNMKGATTAGIVDNVEDNSISLIGISNETTIFKISYQCRIKFWG